MTIKTALTKVDPDSHTYGWLQRRATQTPQTEKPKAKKPKVKKPKVVKAKVKRPKKVVA